MKKAIVFALCLAMLLSLSACGGASTTSSNTALGNHSDAVSLQNSEIQAVLNSGGYVCQAPGGFYFTDNRAGIFRFDRNGTNMAFVRPGTYYSIVYDEGYIYSVKSVTYEVTSLVRISVKDCSEEVLLGDIPFCNIKNIIDGKLYMASFLGDVLVYDIGSQSMTDSFILPGINAVSESGYYAITDGALFRMNFADNSQTSFDQLSDYMVGKIYFEYKGYLLMGVYNDFGEYVCSLNLETGEYNLVPTERGYLGGVGLHGYEYIEDGIYILYNNYDPMTSNGSSWIFRTDPQLQNVQNCMSSEFSDGLAIIDHTLLAPNINGGACRVTTLMGDSHTELADLVLKFPTSLDNIFGDYEEETEALDMSRVYEALGRNNVYTYVDADQSVCTANVYEDGRIDFSVENPDGQKQEWSTTWTPAGTFYDLNEPDTLEDPVQLLWDYTGDKFLIELNSVLTFVNEDANPRFEGLWTNGGGDMLEITRTTMQSSGIGSGRLIGYVNITENVMMLYENNEYGRLNSYSGPVAYVMINASPDGKLLGIACDFTRPGYDEYDPTLVDCVMDAWTKTE